ncbi:MAG: metal-dependent hydrolase [Armatimonadetes bacterium CG_4_10_14_3_um_filter_66_18]|nr:amidohydrolase family protein [Armatimonadota bacterium]OIP11114.1 MAG: metal-dependent hydrolase [Armatimonadetes bacterium CG2_30_66_41]PIU88560.1 MAG: metal-dependent hydrolase [Armatimonadetes bacterium CG06_land_8_20_14_3_00_66_21]PIX37877.1 MAG: metal-dependent hydrolase [Armatimonadetes bacterium CG_4_8_14_3_um_filter_66_20]PIY47180.1 MAG: metal-dependent hydrolase [Armatimonadetes bacterium CG_4_10_14_3_um_filter_66_18]PIZ49707.1 MAG: metal-dependent hydrolase [Armatimonadetes bacte
MLIDVNAYLGHWPFRKLRHNTASALLRLMDKKGIDQAWVSSASAVLYKNPQAANEDLGAETRKHRDRLVPFAVLNPTYADWEYDLDQCATEFDCKGIRLYPDYHNYKLTDSSCHELVAAATERKLLVSIPLRATDARQRHWLISIEDMRAADIVPLIRRFPDARFVLLNGLGYTGCDLGKPGVDLPANYWIEISRLSAVLQAEMRMLLDNVGKSRLVFGTGMPFKYPDPSLVKLEVLEATKSEIEAIRWKNAHALLPA